MTCKSTRRSREDEPFLVEDTGVVGLSSLSDDEPSWTRSFFHRRDGSLPQHNTPWKDKESADRARSFAIMRDDIAATTYAGSPNAYFSELTIDQLRSLLQSSSTTSSQDDDQNIDESLCNKKNTPRQQSSNDRPSRAERCTDAFLTEFQYNVMNVSMADALLSQLNSLQMPIEGRPFRVISSWVTGCVPSSSSSISASLHEGPTRLRCISIVHRPSKRHGFAIETSVIVERGAMRVCSMNVVGIIAEQDIYSNVSPHIW